MEDYLFEKCMREFEFVPEGMKYLEILNREGGCSDTGMHKLDVHDFDSFLYRKPESVFASTPLTGVTSGIRLVIQDDVREAKAFDHNVMSFRKEHYRSLLREMRLQLQIAESSSAVGPFLWWGFWRDPSDAENEYLQIVFRKSDVKWNGTSRGWEMALSYSFRTKITSGYIRGNAGKGDLAGTLASLAACAKPVCHPLLLPVLMLGASLYPETEIQQREVRDTLRGLESAVGGGGRYKGPAAQGYDPETDIKLDRGNHEVAELQWKVMWKRPQVWQGAVRRLNEATEHFWTRLSAEERKIPGLEHIQATIQARLGFAAVRLDGLESYSQVSLQRLNIQREVMNSFISQRESRLSLAIAAQQRRLAHVAGRESTSMKTLTLMGAMFLPGALVSSILGMSFFNFDADIDMNGGTVSPRIWIYFVISVPLTVIIVGAWWTVDQRRLAQAHIDVSDDEMSRLEGRIMKTIRSRTGARVMSEGAPIVRSDELRRQEYAGVFNSRGSIVRLVEALSPWKPNTAPSLVGGV